VRKASVFKRTGAYLTMKSSLGFTKTEICELMRDLIPYTTKDVAESGLPEDFKQFLFDARD
jgi:hypothetical protein